MKRWWICAHTALDERCKSVFEPTYPGWCAHSFAMKLLKLPGYGGWKAVMLNGRQCAAACDEQASKRSPTRRSGLTHEKRKSRLHKRGVAPCSLSNKVQGNDQLGKGRSQQGEHAAAGGELDERLTALRPSLVIASQPTPSGDPGKAAFDD